MTGAMFAQLGSYPFPVAGHVPEHFASHDDHKERGSTAPLEVLGHTEAPRLAKTLNRLHGFLRSVEGEQKIVRRHCVGRKRGESSRYGQVGNGLHRFVANRRIAAAQ